MKLIVLNPNTTQAMTDAVVGQVQRLLPVPAEVVGLTAPRGSPVIDSRETFAIGAASALAMLGDVPAGASAILLACFGDPGLAHLREAARAPVVGLAEAAMREAKTRGQPFAIVAAGANWVPMLRECAAHNGVADLLVDVYALSKNGGQLLKAPEAFRAEVLDLSMQAAGEGATALILGGAAFAGLQFVVDRRLTVIDAMETAVRQMLRT